MKEVSTLKDLMVLHLLSLHDAELQWSTILKDAAKQITSKDLKKIFEKGSKSAAVHADKLNTMLTGLGKSTLSRKNIFVTDLAREIKELQEASADPEVLDAGLIVTHQCMNHYMVAKYGTVSSYARLLLQEDISSSIHEIMLEEKEEDEELSRLAEEKINVKAKAALIH